MDSKAECQLKPELETDDNRKTNLLDLPDLCLKWILRYLDLNSLAIVSSINGRLQDNAVHVFKMKFHHHILDTQEFPETKYDLFETILQQFGAYFVTAKIESNKSQQFLDALLEYSGASLETLTVKFSYFYRSESIIMKRPFTNVKHLTYSLKADDWNATWCTDINQWFPELQSLHISISISETKITDLLTFNIPKLIKLHVKSDESFYSINRPNMLPFLKSNLQLDTVFLNNMNSSHIFGINDPFDWENCKISTLCMGQEYSLAIKDVMKLKHLEYLKISTEKCVDLQKINLPQLKFLFLNIKSKYYNKRIILDFITRCTNLQVLSIDVVGDLQLGSLMRLDKLHKLDLSAKRYSDLDGLTLSNIDKFGIKLVSGDNKSIINFIKRCPILTRLDINFASNKLSAGEIDLLIKTLEKMDNLNDIFCRGTSDSELKRLITSIPNSRNN